MNQQMHRLVFSCRLGMLVAVAENARSSGKTAGGERRSAAGAPDRGAVAALLVTAAIAFGLPGQVALAQTRPPVVFASKLPASATNLPQKYGSGSTNATPRPFAYDPAKGSSSADLSTAGRVGWSVSGSTGTFDQGSVERVVVNWDSFNIGPGFKVHFKQDSDPAKYVSALNRIWSADPTQIFGSLTADREVILLNANGVYFGRGARVDTGKFVATSLSIADSVFEKGLRNITDGSAVFSTTGTNYLPTNLDSGVTVEAGAELRSAAGGDVLLLAPRVVNQGRIETPRGQAVLAAGDKVYLMSSSDPKQRGLIVAVDPVKVNGTNDTELGIAENAATGSYKTVGGATVADTTPDNTSGLVSRLNEMRAESGTVNLVGLTVRQSGQINATTAVKGANGAIYLQAMASTVALAGGPASTTPASRRGLVVALGGLARTAAQMGTVEIGPRSVTAVLPDSSSATQIDAEAFNPSLIRVEGAAIVVGGGASVRAPAGSIALLAAQNSTTSPIFDTGANVLQAMPDGSRIVVAPDALISVAGANGVEVNGSRNQGVQRLFRIELADAPVQRDGPLYRAEVFFDLRDGSKIAAANVTGAAASVGRTALEKSTAGGNLRVESEGAVVVGKAAQLDVSGGTVDYSQAAIRNSLVERNGRVTQFKAAGAGVAIDGILGQIQTNVSPAYTEGRDGGALSISGRRVAVEGQLTGAVTVGERQRDGSSPRAAASSLTLGRQVANAFYMGGIEMGATAGSPVDPGIFTDPMGDVLGGLSASTRLALPALVAGGFGSLALNAGQVVQHAQTMLDLGVGGKLDLRANTIDLAGKTAAPGGTISLTTVNAEADATLSRIGDIHIGADAVLQAGGLWTNDTAAAHAAGSAGKAIQLRGGQVGITAARSLTIDPGAMVDVSAGARLLANGTLSRGTAGSINLGVGRSETFEPTLLMNGAKLAGFDFSTGGKLTLGAPQLTVSNSLVSGFSLVPEFFSTGGFGDVAVNAFGEVRVPAGTVLQPMLRNWQLAAGFRNAPSGPMSNAVVNPVLLDGQLTVRAPVHVNLAASRTLNPAVGLTGSNLVVERGAEISLEPGGRLALSATRNMAIGASGGLIGTTTVLDAPGGQIKLSIVGPRGAPSATSADLDPAGFLSDQVLWLGSDTRVSAAGTAVLRPMTGSVFFSTGNPQPNSPTSRLTGTVLGGGSITLQAERGYVVADAGSTMSVDGASAALNIAGLAGPVRITKPAGLVTVSSPEGFVLDGSISARAPRDESGRALADGGKLELSLGLGGVYNDTAGNVYPGTLVDRSGNNIPGATPKLRQLQIGELSGLVQQRGAVLGANLAASFDNGIGYVPVALLRDAGFDSVQLGAGNRLRFDADLNLNKPLSIGLNAPAIAGAPGVTVNLNSEYIAVGDRSVSRKGSTADTGAFRSPGARTTLNLNAPTIEVFGNSGLQGFSNVHLDAGPKRDGEVRLSALTATNLLAVDAPRYTLNFAGDLDVTAGQVYAGTGARFTLAGVPAIDDADSGSRLTFHTAIEGAASASPLSVFGSLTARATDIVQDGVLRQPFGTISLNAARSLTLGERSITSVAGTGMTRIYGETSNLSQWLAGTSYATSLPVDKSISLSAKTISTSSKAIVDAAGGGDVKAWEFFPGVGGTKDYLAAAGLFALLPDYAQTPASAIAGGQLDPSMQGKQIVTTMDVAGLPRGTYTLLPARYALLGGDLPKGAFLVRRAADQGASVLAAPLQQDDGSVIITGYIRDAGSRNVGIPGERFVVEPRTSFEANSDIRLTSVSDLLQSIANKQELARVPLLPRDGGRVQVALSGNERAIWNAAIRLDADKGRAGLLDMSGANLALVDDLTKTPAGNLGVSAQVLTDSKAGSVLLGGKRSATTDPQTGTVRWTIDQTGTSDLSVDLGSTQLTLEELILTASQRVNLADGTQLNAARVGSLGPSVLSVSGGGALAVVGANPVEIVRTGGAGGAGDLVIGRSSRIAGAQLILNTPGSLRIDPSVMLTTRNLDLGAKAIVVGAESAEDSQATLLSGNLLATARAAPSLTLRSYSTIDFVGNQNWSQRPAASAGAANPAPTAVKDTLVLDTPAIRGLTSAGGVAAIADIAAQSITLRNGSGITTPTLPAGQGELVLQALPPLQYGSTGGLTIGPGTIALGYETVSLRSAGDILLSGAGGVNAMKDLALASARLTAAVGAEQSISADAGRLSVAAEPESRTLGERVGQGAAVRLSGRTVQQLGTIDLPGGKLAIDAKGSTSATAALTFGPGSRTSVAGFELQGSQEGFEAYGQAGSLSATAGLGRIDLLGTVDASAARRTAGGAGTGNAGSIALTAVGAGGQVLLSQAQGDGRGASGVLLGRSGVAAGDLGGQLLVDVGSMPSIDGLASLATAGGITRELTVRVRSGDLELNQNINAERISLSTDAGALTLGSTTLNAVSASGGVVQLAASGDLRLRDTARIDARSLRAGANGGDVLLASNSGRIRLAAGSQIDAGGDDTQDGRIVLRAERGTNNTSVKVDALVTSNLRAGEVDIEAVKTYRNVTSIATGTAGGTTLGQSRLRTDNASFMNAKSAVLNALAVADGDRGRVLLRAGVEVQSSGNLTITSDWQLEGDRPGGDAGFLTVRAAGNLSINGALSDGFSTTAFTGVPNDNTRSWSYRLAAGADLAAANPLAVRDMSGAGFSTGNLQIAAGRLVRTGAGSIELAAGRDISFAAASGNNAQGAAYVAGRKLAGAADVLAGLFEEQGSVSAVPTLTEKGGRLELAARRDITSPEASQLITNWFWRSGLRSLADGEEDRYSNESQLAWWSELPRFRQTLASFGGGNVRVAAGGNIVNVQAMVPTLGWADSSSISQAQLQIRNGGDLVVSAGGDVLGGQFLVGRGEGIITAGGSIAEATGNSRLRAPVLALMDGRWTLSARKEVTTTGAFNPTAMSLPNADNRSPYSGFFYTWGEGGALGLNASAGAINLTGMSTSQVQNYGLLGGGANPSIYARVMPASLKAIAASSDINLFSQFSGGGLLFPSAGGQLEIWSGRNIAFGGSGVVSLAMADSDPILWPDAKKPLSSSQAISQLAGTGGLITSTLSGDIANSALHMADAEPVRILAQGSIRTGSLATLRLAKPAMISAGEDILAIRLIGQNLNDNSLTSIVAGRNFLAGLTGQVGIGGPGVLEIAAGSVIDLDASTGIGTTGNQNNARLSSRGASVKLSAATSGILDSAALQAIYLQDEPAGGNARAFRYRDMLVAYVQTALAKPDIDYGQALARFQSFPVEAQAAFGRQVLAAEFGAIYLEAPAPTAAQMIDALRTAFGARKTEVSKAGEMAIASNDTLVLPGREVLRGGAIASYLAELNALSFDSLNLDSTVTARIANLVQIQHRWRETVAASLGGTSADLSALAAQNPQSPLALAYQAALREFSGQRFLAFRDAALASEIASVGAAASQFGRKSLPMRLALFDQGFRAAELAGAGSVVPQPIWGGSTPLFSYSGSLDMTQSSVVTERGGSISMVNAGGAINVGLKENTSIGVNAAKGVITLGGGDVFGLARNDFQVNTQRVFVVGAGNMNIWSSGGDIDSGRGANTAVAAPPLAARRSVDGIVFELPATTTGSGLGILDDASGNRSGTIGLYPAFGEILALDAFIRAPSVVLGGSIKGADNLQSAAVGGAAAPVSAPALAVAPPSSTPAENRASSSQTSTRQSEEARQRNSLLTVDLLGLGPATADEECSEQDRIANKCPKPLQ